MDPLNTEILKLSAKHSTGLKFNANSVRQISKKEPVVCFTERSRERDRARTWQKIQDDNISV